MIPLTTHLPNTAQPRYPARHADGIGRRRGAAALAPVLAVSLFASAGAVAGQDGELRPNPTRESLTVLPDTSPEHTGIEAPRGSELWAEARLITTYSLNEHLNPFDIDVDVEGDTVTLSGVLDSPAERGLAVRLARDLSGIDNVEDRLQVVPPGEQAPDTNPLYRLVEEANTSARVKLQLLWREPVEGLRVDVTTSEDTLTLTGTVRSEETKQLAEQIARRTTGVAQVENRLSVDPDAGIGDEAGAAIVSAAESLSDTWLTARVAASLRFDRTVDAERIDVSTQDGVVTLSGQVPTAVDKGEATAVASALDGVERVENVLGVEGQGIRNRR
jgi:osmotically-inducible protein OsmY